MPSRGDRTERQEHAAYDAPDFVSHRNVWPNLDSSSLGIAHDDYAANAQAYHVSR